jgi:hypothetical protein
MGVPLDIQLRSTKIEQQAYMQTRGFEIVETLGGEYFVMLLNRLEFNDDLSLHNQVGHEIPDENPS